MELVQRKGGPRQKSTPDNVSLGTPACLGLHLPWKLCIVLFVRFREVVKTTKQQPGGFA